MLRLSSVVENISLKTLPYVNPLRYSLQYPAPSKSRKKTVVNFLNIYIYIYISLKQHCHFATNGFVFSLIRQMLQNRVKINFKPMNRSY